MARALLLIMGVAILIFGLLISAVLLLGHLLPTKQLVYVAAQQNHTNLVLLDFYHRIQVTLIRQAFTPAWSPDGEQIAFYATGESDMPNLYILDVFSHHIQRLTDNDANNVSPSWSPDGREIVFASDYDNAVGIFVMPVDCSDSFERCATRLTPKDTYWYGQPAWSPDGKYIAFVSTKDTANNVPLGNDDIFVMNRDGSHLHRVTDNPNDDYNPAWSPDSRHLVYAAQNIRFGTMAILILDTQCSASGSCMRTLFGDNLVLMPAWSPDGSSIVFVYARDDTNEIYVTDTDGQYLQRLTYNDVNEINPQWRP